ncbi:hypothetical protein KIW84_042266 [Lathyrus oleraceus]|uniref:BED-type domain-containing protein n=1 Tax=Pisum sativum TaxID=3888 RepID=A0A9D5AQD3_PEA|nr:hypothetical protein KIW84_042266 [Pisum sativum]
MTYPYEGLLMNQYQTNDTFGTNDGVPITGFDILNSRHIGTEEFKKRNNVLIIIKMTNVGTTYATSENTVSTPPPTISNEMPLAHTKKRRNRSEAWKHFIVSSEEEQKASCKYYDTKIKYNNGTSSVHAHLSRCLIYKRQRTSSSTTSVEEHVDSPLIVKFDQEAIRRAMIKTFINMEIPFRKVEHESFHEFMSLASPRFQIYSRTTLACDVLKL